MASRYEEVVGSIVDDIRSFFKIKKKKESPYSFTKAEEDVNNNFIQKLADLDKAYRETKILPRPDYDKELPLSLNLDKKSYTKREEEVLASEAEKELRPKFEEQLEKLEQSKEEKLTGLDEDAATYDEKKLTEQQSAANAISELAEKQQEKVIKQGIVHSSINQSGKENIAEYGAAQFERIDVSYDQKYNKLKSAKEEIQSSYTTALSQYEFKHASELSKKVSQLEAEENKRLREINDYNKGQDQKELNYKKERQLEIERREAERKAAQTEKDRLEALDASLNGGFTQADRQQQDKLYEETLKHYKDMDTKAAISLISAGSKNLKARIGEKNYSKLILQLYGE